MTDLSILFLIAYMLVLYVAFRFAVLAMHTEDTGQEEPEQKELVRNDGNDSIN